MIVAEANMNTWRTSNGKQITAESRSQAEYLAQLYHMGYLTTRIGKREPARTRAKRVDSILECLEPRFRYDWLYRTIDDWS
jgi:hypothetical protein